MSLLDDASLLVTPNAEKAGKLYSIIPSNGNGDFSVTRATTATRTNSSGLIESTPINEPRLDYSLGSCPNILLEPQRTNLLVRSEEFDNATSWTPQNITLTANSSTSPSGVTNAETIADNVMLGAHNVFGGAENRPTSTSGATYTYSIFIKAGTRRYVGLVVGAANSGVHMFIDTTNFTTTAAKQFGINTNWVYLSNSITAFANGWYRCSLTFRTDAALALIPSFFLSNVSTSTSPQPSYVGDGSNTFLWGAQLEAGAYPTSYIPTSSASVTRNADVISSTIPSILNASSGTLFVDAFPVVTSAFNQTIASINDGTTSRGFWLGLDNGVLQVRFRNAGGITAANSSFSITNLQRIKIALTWNGSAITLFANGVKRINNNSLGANYPSTINTIQMQGDGSFFGINRNFINSMALFPTPLTDTQCIALTT